MVPVDTGTVRARRPVSRMRQAPLQVFDHERPAHLHRDTSCVRMIDSYNSALLAFNTILQSAAIVSARAARLVRLFPRGSMKSVKVLLLAGASACCLLGFLSSCESTTEPVEQAPPLPEPTADQVGLPIDWATKFRPFYVFDRPDTRQVRVVYGNDTANTGTPYQHGSVLVMETYRARLDAQGVPVRNAAGRFERDALLGIFVMRKDKWLGRRYKEHQTGDWEYASFLPDGTPSVVGDAAAQGCAVCHLDAGPSRDWVYRGNIPFGGAS